MSIFRNTLSICLFFIFSVSLINAKVTLYTNEECSHILIDNMQEDLKSPYIRSAFDINIKEEYNCWKRSEVRLRNTGKLIDPESLMDLTYWLLEEDTTNDFYAIRRKLRDVYIESNEFSPCQAMSVFQQSHPRPLLSVGTERGFIAAAIAKSNSLFLVDVTPDVVVYNYIAYLLLKASDSRFDYLYLRQSATCEEWISAFIGKNIDIKENIIREVSYLWKFWNDKIRSNDSVSIETDFSNITKTDFQYFANVNYIYDDSLFCNIKRLADSDMIFVFLVDVSSVSDLSDVVNHVYPNKFGIIDLSNIIAINENTLRFNSPYLSESEHQMCFNAFKAASDENTQLIWTSPSKQLHEKIGFWVYRSMPLLKTTYPIDPSVIWRSELTDFEACRVRD